MDALLERLLRLSGMERLDGAPVTAENVRDAVDRLKLQLEGATNAAALPAAKPIPKRALVIGEQRFISFQIKQMLSRFKTRVQIVQSLEQAVAAYDKKDFELVVIDLYMPTEEEGLLVLEELKKIARNTNKRTEFVILSSQTDNLHISQICQVRGVNLFLEKNSEWHQRFLRFVLGQPDLQKN